jgi:hypothetical protein
MNNVIEVRYSIEGVPRCNRFETMDEAEAFVTSLLIAYGEGPIEGLTIEQLE